MTVCSFSEQTDHESVPFFGQCTRQLNCLSANVCLYLVKSLQCYQSLMSCIALSPAEKQGYAFILCTSWSAL